MSKQEKLISADKLMEWLSRKMWDREDKGNYYAYESVQDEIEAGTFNPDPEPTIKQEDMYRCACGNVSSQQKCDEATEKTFGSAAYFVCPVCETVIWR